MSALSLAPRALYEEVAELLRQRIFARELEPGSWIDELRIAEALGISRTPLREALKVLAAEGLVTMKVRRGAYVTEVNDKDQHDVYHLLSLLESDAAGVVAVQASDAELADLNSIHQELVAAVGNTDKFFEINERFHMRLLEIANNPKKALELLGKVKDVGLFSEKIEITHKTKSDEELEAEIRQRLEVYMGPADVVDVEEAPVVKPIDALKAVVDVKPAAEPIDAP